MTDRQLRHVPPQTCGGSVLLTNEPAKCRRSLTSRGRDEPPWPATPLKLAQPTADDTTNHPLSIRDSHRIGRRNEVRSMASLHTNRSRGIRRPTKQLQLVRRNVRPGCHTPPTARAPVFEDPVESGIEAVPRRADREESKDRPDPFVTIGQLDVRLP